jgi:hypothetical protein
LLRRWCHTWQEKKKNTKNKQNWHLKPPACTKLLHSSLHWETRRAPEPPDASSKPAWEMQTNRWASKWHVVLPQSPLGYTSISPCIDDHCPANKNTWIINKELKRTRSRDGGVLWAHWRRGEEQGAALHVNFQ